MEHQAPASFPPPSTDPVERAALRRMLRERRRAFARGGQAGAAEAALRRHLLAVLNQLDPTIVGLYWAIDGEFTVTNLTLADAAAASVGGLAQAGSAGEGSAGAPWPWTVALPYAHRAPAGSVPRMDYRRWDGRAPAERDGQDIPTAQGPVVVPDVVLVPCVGYTDAGDRLGFGAGFYDAWLSAHPGVTPVGVAWSVNQTTFMPAPHDQRLPIIVTDAGVLTPD